jgi:UDP-N-acetylglucosamine--N-acetylmuramyl-(pentapeptide) pyrophosphoryl-undecaprenol N-acetylglucosamine transferase
MKVIIAGGGTGGHLFPGIALATHITKKYPSSKVIFVGTEKGLEAKVIPNLGYELKLISASGFVGKSINEKVKSLLKLLKSISECKSIISSFLPDIVFGVGGYASLPMVFTATLKKIPSIIIEQNTVPGLANKILGKFVDAIAITYSETMDYFPKEKVYLTGTPIRNDVLSGVREKALRIFNLEDGKMNLLIFGGSLGARKINKAVTEGLNYLFHLKDKIQIIHQTGEMDYEWVEREYKKHSFRATVLPFIYDMAEAYALADLIICRAGASTVAEITALGKASILIPYPYAAYNHQEINARRLYSRGACEMILDKDLNGRIISEKINRIITNPKIKREIEIASFAFGKINAAEKVVEIGESIMRRKSYVSV